jgi:hypothetical protein
MYLRSDIEKVRPEANGMELFPVDHPSVSVNASCDDPEVKKKKDKRWG